MINVYEISLLPRPLIGGVSFAINGEHLNPTIYLSSGETYIFKVSSNAQHGFVIKQGIGANALTPYPDVINNGTYQGEITFEVTTDTPRQLVYQSSTDPTVVGLILVDAKPYALTNGIQLLRTDGYADGIKELIDKVNHNMRLVLTINDPFAGAGLKLEGKTLSVDSPSSTIYYQAPDGQVIRSDQLFTINDQTPANAATELPLHTTLDLLAKQIRSIKDPSKAWTEANSENLKTLETRINQLKQDAEALNRRLAKLKTDASKKKGSNG